MNDHDSNFHHNVGRMEHRIRKVLHILELVIAKLNIDEVPLVAHKEAIEVIPTLVLYRNGKALGSIVAPESKARIEQFIDESLA